ncbi:MAG: ATP-dependent sacrificial sulfur transferase LarE [Candidatus Dormibacteraceae bacterium]
MIQLEVAPAAHAGTVREIIRQLGSVLIAFSGGVDSSLLLKLAQEELGNERVVAALASSPAYPSAEQEQARQIARELGARLVEVDTSEVELDAYRINRPDRCFHCKEELFDKLQPLQQQLGLDWLAYGANADDAGDHRPGHASALRRGVRFPLLEGGMGKGEIRLLARQLGLSNWNKSPMACLSSRVPHGQPISEAILRQIGEAEAVLQRLGLEGVRVRHHGEVARIEVAATDLNRVVERRQEVIEGVRAAGYLFVALDLEGYRMGSLNRSWRGGGGE